MSEIKLVRKDIGSGTYGTVSIVEKQNERYALKVFNRDSGGIYHSLKEIDVLFRLQSDRIIKGEQILSKGKYSEIFGDNLTGCLQQLFEGDLYHDFSDLPGNRYQLGIQILFEIAEGIEHLYRGGYYHLDIKADNILFSKVKNKVNFVLADYGMCIPVQNGITTIGSPHEAGTFIFLAPEVIKHNRVEYASCSWPLAITIYQLLFLNGEYFNKSDYDQESEFIVNDVKNTIDASHFRLTDKLYRLRKHPMYDESEYFCDILLLLRNMTLKNIKRRWTPSQVVNYLSEKYQLKTKEVVIKQPIYPSLSHKNLTQKIKEFPIFFEELIESVKHINKSEETQILLKEFTLAWHYFYYLYFKNIINLKVDYVSIIFKCVELARLFYTDEASLYELRPEKFMIGFLNEIDKIIYHNPLACLTPDEVYSFFQKDPQTLIETYPSLKTGMSVLKDEIVTLDKIWSY